VTRTTSHQVLSGPHTRPGNAWLVLGHSEVGYDAENSAHLSLSNGERRCPYPAPLPADVIARTAVETLLERLPDLVPAVEPEELTWRPSIWMRGLTALPVEFAPVVQ
jgi:cytochrome P450